MLLSNIHREKNKKKKKRTLFCFNPFCASKPIRLFFYSMNFLCAGQGGWWFHQKLPQRTQASGCCQFPQEPNLLRTGCLDIDRCTNLEDLGLQIFNMVSSITFSCRSYICLNCEVMEWCNICQVCCNICQVRCRCEAICHTRQALKIRVRQINHHPMKPP